MLVAPFVLLACGSAPKAPKLESSPDPPTATTGSAGANAAAPSSDKPETEAQRRVRQGLARRQQCSAVGNAIQNAQREDAILNINDAASLQRTADDLGQSAAAIEAVPVTDDGLKRLRDEYVGNNREMAKQLEVMAKAKNEAGRRAASAKFSACQDKTSGYIRKLNDYCNAPVR
jgi:hypothetical protein